MTDNDRRAAVREALHEFAISYRVERADGREADLNLMMALIDAECLAVLDRVEADVIGKDEAITTSTEYDKPKWVEQENNISLGANQLRAVQRKAIESVRASIGQKEEQTK